METYKFFIYDGNDDNDGNDGNDDNDDNDGNDDNEGQTSNHRKEGYTMPGPAIVLTRAGTVMEQEDYSRRKKKSENRYFSQYRNLVTEREAGHPAVARNVLFLVQQARKCMIQLKTSPWSD